jgi:MazG family protein
MPASRSAEDASASFLRLVDIMARLRAPGGCPWDREQTPSTLRPYVIEEAYEVVEAIEHGEPGPLCDELGDLLLQVVFQAELATESGEFTIADVARAVGDKLVRRHPHVFGDVSVENADEVMRNWRRIKAEERRARGEATTALAGVPAALPALDRAQQLGEKAAHVGLDWPDLGGVVAKLREEQAELEEAIAAGDRAGAARELGDVLLTLTSVARHLGASAEMALRDAVGRFTDRVGRVEAAAEARGVSLATLGPDELERMWSAAKAAEPGAKRRPSDVV